MNDIPQIVDLERIGIVLGDAKKLAIEYRQLTGKPLGITGEIAEYEAARLLGLQLCEARQAGYDAIRTEGKSGTRIQIKGRCVISSNPGQKLGKIRLDQEWDSVVLVLMTANFEPYAIYEAERQAVEEALVAPGSKARNERGALSVSKFRSIAQPVWTL